LNAEIAEELRTTQRARATSWRFRFVRTLGPAVVLAGLAWAIAQPYRLTLLHPFGQGGWWLLSEPPLFVVAVGVLFHLVVARGLAEDLEE
jgi:hypothetical protein